MEKKNGGNASVRDVRSLQDGGECHNRLSLNCLGGLELLATGTQSGQGGNLSARAAVSAGFLDGRWAAALNAAQRSQKLSNPCSSAWLRPMELPPWPGSKMCFPRCWSQRRGQR